MSTTENPIDDSNTTTLPTTSDSTATVYKVNYTVDYIHESGPYTINTADEEKYLGFDLDIDPVDNDPTVLSHFLDPTRCGHGKLKQPIKDRLQSIAKGINTLYLADHEKGKYTCEHRVDKRVKRAMEKFLAEQSEELSGIRFEVGTSTDSFPNRQPRPGAYWISRDVTKGSNEASQGEVESSGLWGTLTGYFK